MKILHELPIIGVKETFWWRTFYDQKTNKVIQRDHLILLWLTSLKSAGSQIFMRVKWAAAQWLLRGVGEPCPYCSKTIQISPWKKMFD